MPSALDLGPGVGTGQSTTLITLGRISLPAIQDDFKEGFGATLDTTGAGAALGQRRPKAFTFTIPILAFQGTGGVDLLAVALRMRRQVRAMLQNAQLRGQGIYFTDAVDPELNGWVMIGAGQIGYADGNIVAGGFTITIDDIYRVGSRWTHRPGLRCLVADRRLGATPRDQLEQLFSTDFYLLPALSVVGLPPAITDVATSTGSKPALGLWSGSDGLAYAAIGVADGEVVSFEVAEASRNLGQVVAYDRRGGTLTAGLTPGPALTPSLTLAPAGATIVRPDPSLWEEVHGAEWPWNWLTAGQLADAPVLANGRCRVRLDATSVIGFAVDVWTGSAWTEQGKVVVNRHGVTRAPCDTFVSAGLVANDCTSERTVVQVVLEASSDPVSRETIYISLQRGWSGPRFEVYPSLESSGSRAGAELAWYNADATETSCVVVKLDAAQTDIASAVNSASLPGAAVGVAFDGENHWTMLAQGRAYAVVGAVVQAAAYIFAFADPAAYGVTRNAVGTITDPPSGYVSLSLAFPAQATDQLLEAEAIRNTSGTTSQVADATASGGQCVKDTQTTQAAATVAKATTNLVAGARYRVLARVKVDSGATGSFAAYSGPVGAGVVATTTSTTWVWVDCNELVIQSPTELNLNGWRSAGGSGAVYVDCLALVKLEDRITALPLYDGARDLGQSVLTDSRAVPALVER